MNASRRALVVAVAVTLLSAVMLASVRASSGADGSARQARQERALAALDAKLAALSGTSAEVKAARAQLSEVRALVAASTAPADSGADVVSVSGVGRVEAKPDTAHIELGASTTRPTVRAAMSATNAAVRAMIASIRSNGVAARDIKTSSVALHERNRDDGTLLGYTASNSLRVRLRDVARAGEVIQDALDAGDDAARFHGLSFEIADNDRHAKVARERAVRDAHEKAALYAALVGRSLGPAISVTEQSSPSPQPFDGGYALPAAGAASGESVPIEEGADEVVVVVSITYALR